MAWSQPSFVNGLGFNTALFVIPPPAGVVAGDLLVAAIHCNGTVNSAPSGWTIVNPGQNTSWWKIATGSEPATYDWTSTVNSDWAGTIALYRGHRRTSPRDNSLSQNGGSGSPASFLSLSPDRSGELLIAVIGATWSGTASSIAVPAGMSSPSGAVIEQNNFNVGVLLAHQFDVDSGTMTPGTSALATGAVSWITQAFPFFRFIGTRNSIL